jgi:periplasmic protein TonB
LLYETPQGLVRTELSPRQRIYLLWTFRNFRQLSMALLNDRQRALVIDLFNTNAGLIPPSCNPSPVIGVVEDFVPPPTAPSLVPALSPATAPSTVPLARASTMASTLPLNVQIDAPPSPIVAQKPVEIPVEIKPRPEMDREIDLLEKIVAQRAAIAPLPQPVRASSTSPSPLSLSLPIFALFKRATSKLTMSKLATAVGALCVCVISVVALQRIQVVPSSQANNQPLIEPSQFEQLQPQQSKANSLPDSQNSAAPVANAINPVALAPSIPATNRRARAKVAVTAASTAPVISARVSTPVSAPTSAATRTRKPAVRPPHTASTPNFQVSAENSAIQASRPPLHFAYPNDVHARGTVALTAAVDSDGTVRSVRIISGNRALAAAAARAIRHWRYTPYLKDGQPVATETNIVISFFSNDAISMTFPPAIPANRK